VVERRQARGRARLGVLRSHTFEHDLGPFVRGAIEGARATVHTDGLATYRPLAEVGVRHEFTVQGRDPARAVRRLPWSHAVFYHLKAWLRGTFRGVSPEHLARYLDEFAYRFSHRDRDTELAGLILERSFAAPPLTYPRLVEGNA
jgi:transposase-like protein